MLDISDWTSWLRDENCEPTPEISPSWNVYVMLLQRWAHSYFAPETTSNGVD